MRSFKGIIMSMYPNLPYCVIFSTPALFYVRNEHFK